MKKRIQVTVPLAFILVAIAAAVVAWKCDPGRPLRILFSCAYTASGIAALVALDGVKGRLIVFWALFGIVLSGYNRIYAVMIVTFISGRSLYSLLGSGEEEDWKADIELPPGSGFLLKSLDQQYYQLLRGRDRLYFVNLGSRHYLAESAHPIRAEEDYVSKDGDRVIPFDRIRSIRIGLDGSLRIRGRRCGHYFIQSPATVDDVAASLAELPVQVQRPPAPKLSEAGARTLNDVFFALSLANLFCAGAWIYLGTPARLFAILNFLFLFAAFALFCLFYEVIASPIRSGKECPGPFSFFVSMLPLLFFFQRGYRFNSAVQFVVPVAILSGCALLLFLALNARGGHWGMAMVLFPAAILVSVLIVGNANVLFDDSARTGGQTAVVLYKEGNGGTENGDDYALRIGPPALRVLDVSREIYEAVEAGDEVLIATHTERLGIDYTDVELPGQ